MEHNEQTKDLSIILKYIDSIISDQPTDHHLSLQFHDFSTTVDPKSFVYNNYDQINSDGHSIRDDLSSLIWRIHGTDDGSSLPKESFLNKYIPTLLDVTHLYNNINPNFKDQHSEDYKKYKDYLGLDTLEGRISPLYGLTRSLPIVGKPSVFSSSIPLASDRQSVMLEKAMNDDSVSKDDEVQFKEYLNKMAAQYNSIQLDQLNNLFFFITNGYLEEKTGYMLCSYPTLQPISAGRDKNTIVANLFASNYPVYQPLRSIQFFIKKNSLHLKMTFDFFNCGNMFDILYGITLLSLAVHYGKYEMGLVHIDTPYYIVYQEHFPMFIHKKNNYDNLVKNSLMIIPKDDLTDFSSLTTSHLKVSP